MSSTNVAIVTMPEGSSLFPLPRKSYAITRSSRARTGMFRRQPGMSPPMPSSRITGGACSFPWSSWYRRTPSGRVRTGIGRSGR